MTDGPVFVPGVELSRALFEEAVRPLLEQVYPGLEYAACRIGSGSEVQGFDTARSTDHGWGPRLLLVLRPEVAAEHAVAVSRLLAERLPRRVRGWPTNFSPAAGDPSSVPVVTDGPVDHGVEVTGIGAWLIERVGSDAAVSGPVSTVEWLSMPQQRLAEATGGVVFHDGLGDVTAVRARLAWYPEGVWRYVMACQWMKLSQEEAFVGRTAEVGDELGSMVVAARQVRELMRLALLQEKRYAPYSKWLGSAFARYVSGSLPVVLEEVLRAGDADRRQARLCDAYEVVGRRHNRLGLTEVVDVRRRRFHSRPFDVLGAWRFAHALRGGIGDRVLRSAPLTGAVDQWADNTDFIGRPRAIRAAVRKLLAGGT